jgi:uncharacterized protein YndB with AHSA1/START domain
MTEIAPVEVTMHIAAAPGDVFPYFTDPARYVQWMGSEAKLEPEPGGMYRVHMSNGFKAAGTFLQVEPPDLVIFTWGFADEKAAQHTLHERAEAASGNAMPPGSMCVTVTLDGVRAPAQVAGDLLDGGAPRPAALGPARGTAGRARRTSRPAQSRAPPPPIANAT